MTELVDVLQRRERTKPVALQTHVSPLDVADKTRSRSSPRMSRFDASLDGSPDGGLTLAHDILDVADLDQSDDIDFAEFAAVQRGVLQSHPELMTSTPRPSSSSSSSTSGSRKGGGAKGEAKEKAKEVQQQQGSEPNHHHSQGNNKSKDGDDDVVVVARLRGTGDAVACRAIARGIVAAGISRSPEAAPWQEAQNDDNGNSRDKYDENNNESSGLGSSQHRSSRDRGVFFAIDVYGTVGNQLLEKLLIRAGSNSTLESSEKKPGKEGEPISSTTVGVEVSSDGSTIASSPASSAVKSTSEDLLPKALRQLALTKPQVPYIDLGPELGQLRVVNLGCSAVRERWALRSSQSNSVSSSSDQNKREEPSPQLGRRQHPCGDPLGTSANDDVDNIDGRSSSSSGSSSLTRYAAATAGQLAVGAVDLCAEPWPELLARLGLEGKSENILKVERLCFGAAYVLELLSAYGLLRPEHEAITTTSGGGAGAESGNDSSTSNDDNDDVNVGAPRLVGRSDSSGSEGARVVFVESFGEVEASWALGALVHRLLAEPPPA